MDYIINPYLSKRNKINIIGSEWEINRTMAQVHALLLVSSDALTTEDIMSELNISRGNANMNLGFNRLGADREAA